MASENVFEEACRRIHDGKSSVNAEKRRIHAAAGTIRTYYKALYGTDCPKAKPEIALPEEEKRRREAVREAAIRIHNGETYISTEVKRLGTTKQTLDHYHQEMYGCPCPRLNRRGRKKKEPADGGQSIREAVQRIHDGESTVYAETVRIGVKAKALDECHDEMYGTPCPRQFREEKPDVRGEIREAVRRIHDGESTAQEEKTRLGTTRSALDRYYEEAYGERCPRGKNGGARKTEIQEAVRRIHDRESTVTAEAKRVQCTVKTIHKHYEATYGERPERRRNGWDKPGAEQRPQELQEAVRRIHEGMSTMRGEMKRIGTNVTTLDKYYQEVYGEKCPRVCPKNRRKREEIFAPVPKDWFEVIGKVKTYELTHTKAAELLHMTPTEMRTLYEKITGERLDRIWPHWRDYLKGGRICWPVGLNPMAI